MKSNLDPQSIVAVLMFFCMIIGAGYAGYSRLEKLENTVAEMKNQNATTGRDAISKLNKLQVEFDTLKTYICVEIEDCE